MVFSNEHAAVSLVGVIVVVLLGWWALSKKREEGLFTVGKDRRMMDLSEEIEGLSENLSLQRKKKRQAEYDAEIANNPPAEEEKLQTLDDEVIGSDMVADPGVRVV